MQVNRAAYIILVMLLKTSRITFILLAEIKNNIFEVCGGIVFLNLPIWVLCSIWWTVNPSTIFSCGWKRIHFNYWNPFQLLKTWNQTLAKPTHSKHPLTDDYRLCLALLLVAHGTRCCGWSSNLYAVVVVTEWLQNFPRLQICCVDAGQVVKCCF